MSRPTQRLALILGGLILGLAAAELAARLVLVAKAEEQLDLERHTPGELKPMRPVGLGDLIRVSDVPDLIFELRPDIDRAIYAGAPISTNREGFRRSTPIPERNPRSYRILGLGDSVMFGQGVPDGREYLARLEQNLNRDDPSREWVVINSAVPGYNTAQQLAFLEARGLDLQPDLVILGFVSNDVNLPSFLSEQPDPWSLGHLAVLELIFGRKSNSPAPSLTPAPTQDDNLFRVEADPEKVPERWRHLLGWDSVERSLDRLAALSEEHGFRVLLFCHRQSEFTERALEAARKRGFATCDLAPRLDNYMREHEIPRYRGSTLTVSEADPHPSPVHHRIAADGLQRALERIGIATPPD